MNKPSLDTLQAGVDPTLVLFMHAALTSRTRLRAPGFSCALDLVKYMRSSYGDYFSIQVHPLFRPLLPRGQWPTPRMGPAWDPPAPSPHPTAALESAFLNLSTVDSLLSSAGDCSSREPSGLDLRPLERWMRSPIPHSHPPCDNSFCSKR